MKEKWGKLGQVAVGGAGQLNGIGVARWKAWPAVEKCLLKFSIIVDLSVVTVSLTQCSGQLGVGAPILHGLYIVPERFGVSAAGCKFLFEKWLLHS